MNAEHSVGGDHPASIITLHYPLIGGACTLATGPMTWTVESPSSRAGDDVAPTSLNDYEGRGKEVSVLVVVFHLSLTRRLVDGWSCGGGTSGRGALSGQPKCRNVPERRKRAIFGKVARRGFLRCAAVPKAVSSRNAMDKPCCKGKDGMCI